MANAQAQDIPYSEQPDLISYEEVERWSVESLKDFCRKRGFKVTGSKVAKMAKINAGEEILCIGKLLIDQISFIPAKTRGGNWSPFNLKNEDW